MISLEYNTNLHQHVFYTVMNLLRFIDGLNTREILEDIIKGAVNFV